jgi:hypothetical protein
MDGDNKAALNIRIRKAMNYGFDRQKVGHLFAK